MAPIHQAMKQRAWVLLVLGHQTQIKKVHFQGYYFQGYGGRVLQQGAVAFRNRGCCFLQQGSNAKHMPCLFVIHCPASCVSVQSVQLLRARSNDERSLIGSFHIQLRASSSWGNTHLFRRYGDLQANKAQSSRLASVRVASSQVLSCNGSWPSPFCCGDAEPKLYWGQRIPFMRSAFLASACMRDWALLGRVERSNAPRPFILHQIDRSSKRFNALARATSLIL